MIYVKMSKINDVCEHIQFEIAKGIIITTNRLLTKDVDDGQPTVWAEVVAKGEKFDTRREAVEPIPVIILANDTDTEL